MKWGAKFLNPLKWELPLQWKITPLKCEIRTKKVTPTDRQTDRQTDRKTVRQWHIDRLKQTERLKQTDRQRKTKMFVIFLQFLWWIYSSFTPLGQVQDSSWTTPGHLKDNWEHYWTTLGQILDNIWTTRGIQKTFVGYFLTFWD